MPPKKIKSINFQNGLNVKLYDISRKLAGDRWYVGLLIQIDIPISDSLLNEKLLAPYSIEEIKNALGETICFEQKRERHFIDKLKKKDLLHDFTESFLKSYLTYFIHPDFASKYVLKEYKKYLERQTWYQEENREVLLNN